MSRSIQNRDLQLETSGKIIGFYEREFYCFSNFSSFKVEWRDRLWPTSEHAYQAARFEGESTELFTKVLQAKSAHEAYKIMQGNRKFEHPDWYSKKVDTMIDICRHKLVQHEYIQHKLEQTGKHLIVEDSPKDSFWGWGPDRKGRNELGKIWMNLRKELQEGKINL